ncbi:hypothetical protein GQX73_g7688 [Xylaria multiplex]|uniref:Uncharacterized protein n=1 Tax=Xylaria multiplex TaxID=323545 RepID=A0A7C8MR05_9PEZI|nr:hypothetical protein GQX73_g7688 [Xylaria multiplex]
MEKIAHKVSNKSLQSKCSHESSDDDLFEVRDQEADSTSFPASPSASPLPAGLEDGHGPDTQLLRGRSPSIDDSAIPVESSQRGTAAPRGSSQGKHKTANGSLVDVDHESAHSRESKVKLMSPGFEDVDLSDSGKKTSS